MSELTLNTPFPDEEASSRKAARQGRATSASRWDARFGLVSEETFVQMVCLERKRAERSRKPFLLLLLDSKPLLERPQKDEFLSKIVNALSASMRETDVRGWYEGHSVLGVIYSEITGDTAVARKAILSKVSAALGEHLEARHLQEIRLSCEVFPADWDPKKPLRASDSGVYPDLFRENGKKKFSQVIKRGIDVVGSLLALLFLAPVFLVIAVATRLTSKGPILFRQERVGQYGEHFTFLKFRSMDVANDDRIHQEYVQRLIAGGTEAADAAAGGPVVYKITQDPRVTPVGRILRKTSLDELPQFVNVLRGEMSLVGPRPPVSYEVEAYDVWHRRRVLEAKPGITGLWQVTGRSRTNFDDMVRLDLQYVRTWSLWLDLKILLKTPGAVFSGEGAY